MTLRLRTLVALLLSALSLAAPAAHAHVGSKDIFEQINAGPYPLYITIRPPNVIPGVATVDVQTSTPNVRSIDITPIPLTGEASKHPPTPDLMKPAPDNPTHYTGSLWLMSAGSWQVRFHLLGEAGEATTNIPVPAMPLTTLRMTRGLGALLTLLGLILAVGMGGIVAAAVREAPVPPGEPIPSSRRRPALLATIATVTMMALTLLGGAAWWNVEAASYAQNVYRPLALTPTLHGNTLNLQISTYTDPNDILHWRSRSNADFLPDHGHLMHLYAIRQPGMDAVFHLHPTLAGPGDFQLTLPSMPPGTYRLFADIVHSNGFPETLVANLTIPPGLPPTPLSPEDASGFPAPLVAVQVAVQNPRPVQDPRSSPPTPSTSTLAGTLGPVYKLPDGYTMVWHLPSAPQSPHTSPQTSPVTSPDNPSAPTPDPAPLTANAAYTFQFTLLDPAGHPATDMQPYLGMAGHAAFVKTDGTTFAHTHPEGSAAMPAMMLANAGPDAPMPGMSNTPATMPGAMPGMSTEKITPNVSFPYGFPAPGHYRIFIQMKHGQTVETGVFDANVQ